MLRSITRAAGDWPHWIVDQFLEAHMRFATLDVIRDEHKALAALLGSLSLLLEQARRDGAKPDCEVLRAMLFYIDQFPERLHHKKENQFLFPKVRERVPELCATLDRLEQDHANGERAIRELQHALLAFEVLGDPRRAAFEDAVKRYVAFYLEHMAIEERDIFPAALRVFSTDDWTKMDAAFAANKDPLTGHEPNAEYVQLFRLIVMHEPASISLDKRQTR